MNYGGISIENYLRQGDGFGEESLGNVNDLNKALEATHERGGAVEGSTTASGAPLKVESLEKTLKVITFTMKNIVLWKELPVLPAYNTVEEYNKQTSYGADTGGFVSEGELPEEMDATYVRESQLVKYLGNTRIVTHPMTLVNTAHGDIIQREVDNGTIWILQRLEPALFKANSNIIPIEFNGFITQQMLDFSTEIQWLDSDNVIDLRGDCLTEATAEQAANAIVENYGVATDLYASPRAMSDFVKTFYSRERVMLPTSTTGQSVGTRVTQFVSQAGTIDLKPDVFLRANQTKTPSSAATSSKAPPAPIADATTPIAAVGATVANSKWDSVTAGTYIWAVSALNKYGESALTVLSQNGTAIVSGGAAALKFTAGVGAFPTNGFRIYIGKKGVAYSSNMTFYPLFDVSAAQLASGYNGGSAGVIYDLNRYLPDTTKAFIVQRDIEVMSFKQLAPLMKMDLALLSPAYRFMVLLYGTPLFYAPRKAVTFINVGSNVPS